MAYKLMIQGTTKGAGKSFILAGIARAFTELGFKVCPFKAVEYATDTFVTKEGAKISKNISELSFVAKTEPSVYMNPVLLKQISSGAYRVFVNGEFVGTMSKEEFSNYRRELIPQIELAVKELEKKVDIILFEGEGNPSNIEYREDDISNMGLARMFNIPVLIVGDWSTGGALASLHGTIDFLKYEEKRLIKGMIINRYYEDFSGAGSGIKQLETRSGKNVLGKVPVSEIDLFADEAIVTSDKKEPDKVISKPIDVAIIKLPRMTNSIEFGMLEANEKFSVRYIRSADQLKEPELVIIPGTKSTIPDLRWFKAMGFGDAIKNLPKNTKIFGICGGFQMLGSQVLDPHFVEGGGSENGLGLLPIRTILNKDRWTRPVQTRLVDLPKNFQFLEKITVSGEFVGNSETEVISEEMDNRAYGLNIHGFFENESVLKAFERGFMRLEAEESDFERYRENQFEKCGSLIERIFDLEELEVIMGMKKK